jgi:hypothetical protein
MEDNTMLRCARKKCTGCFCKNYNATCQLDSDFLDLFVHWVQVVVPLVLVLQVVVLNCTSDASCGTKSVYYSLLIASHRTHTATKSPPHGVDCSNARYTRDPIGT